jgi:epoxyqueuosine reductase
MGDWLFGCDVCQEVCPWNRDAPQSSEPDFEPAEGMNPVELAALFDLDDAAFRRRFRRTALWRPKRRGLLRNAAIALGNRPSREALPALIKGLDDFDPIVRTACAWALGRYDDPEARVALRSRQAVETDSEVIEEIAAAM